MGLTIGFLLFILLNWAVANHFSYVQRLESHPNEFRNTFNIWNTANEDKYPIKIYFLGNSVQYGCLDFKFLQSKLEKMVKHDIQVYNLAVLAAKSTDYAIILSQLKIDKSTLVVIPVSGGTFTFKNSMFHSDLDALLAKPSIIKALGYDFYKENVTLSQLWTSLLKTIFPLYKYRYLTKYDLLKEYFPKPAKPQRKKFAKSFISEKNEVYLKQFDRVLENLKSRDIAHLVYMQPTQETHQEKSTAIYGRIRWLLKEHDTPWVDLSNLHENSEYLDPFHVWYNDQLWELLGALNKIKPKKVKEVPASEIGLAMASGFASLTDVVKKKRRKYFRASLNIPVVSGPDKHQPIVLKSGIDGVKINPRPNVLIHNPTDNYSSKRMDLLIPYKTDLANSEVRIEYLTLDPDLSGSTERKVNKMVRVYSLDLDPSIAENEISRIHIESPKTSVAWIFQNGRPYIIVPAGLEASVENVSVFIYDSSLHPSGPLAEAVFKIDNTLNGAVAKLSM